MNSSAWVLTVGYAHVLDVFVARTAQLALKWLRIELAESEVYEAALAGALTVSLRCIDGAASTTEDLRRFVHFECEGIARTPLHVASALARLARRLERRHEDEAVLDIDERAMLAALPSPTAAPLDHLGVVVHEGRSLPVGAHLARAHRQLEDIDPRPTRTPAHSPLVQSLFEAVYAAPDDDAPRQILADALEELGDPRGAFIRNQLLRATTGAPASQHERAQLEHHEQAWLGELHRNFSRVTWARGFPEAAHLSVNRGLARRELSTLRRANLSGPGQPATLAGLTHLERLVGITAMTTPLLDNLTRLRELRLDGRLTLFREPVDELRAFAANPPRTLQRLEVCDALIEASDGERSGRGRYLDAHDWDWLWNTPLGRQLHHFAAATPFEALPTWLTLASHLPVPLLTLRVTQYGNDEPLWARLQRGSSVLEVTWRPVRDGYLDRRDTFELLVDAVRGSRAITAVELEHPDPPDSLRALANAGVLKLCSPATPHPTPLWRQW